MLLNRAALAGIADGTVRFVYRRWNRPRVKVGSTLRTAIGVVAVDAVEETTTAAITESAARRAGFASRAALLAELAKYREGVLYRIAVRRAGADPRVRLRRKARFTSEELAQLEHRLRQLGARSESGPWAFAVLLLIQARPGVRARALAPALHMNVARFKPRVRQLKQRGLTESLEVGYRLSPRGRALLRQLARR